MFKKGVNPKFLVAALTMAEDSIFLRGPPHIRRNKENREDGQGPPSLISEAKAHPIEWVV